VKIPGMISKNRKPMINPGIKKRDKCIVSDYNTIVPFNVLANGKDNEL
jgi:hypothetical protein